MVSGALFEALGPRFSIFLSSAVLSFFPNSLITLASKAALGIGRSSGAGEFKNELPAQRLSLRPPVPEFESDSLSFFLLLSFFFWLWPDLSCVTDADAFSVELFLLFLFFLFC